MIKSKLAEYSDHYLVSNEKGFRPFVDVCIEYFEQNYGVESMDPSDIVGILEYARDHSYEPTDGLFAVLIPLAIATGYNPAGETFVFNPGNYNLVFGMRDNGVDKFYWGVSLDIIEGYYREKANLSS